MHGVDTSKLPPAMTASDLSHCERILEHPVLVAKEINT
jgi:hypothetical protein